MTRRLLRIVSQYLGAWFSCLYLLTAGLFSARHRAALAAINRHMGLFAGRDSAEENPPPVEPGIPSVRSTDLADDDLPIIVCEPDAANGNVSGEELVVIDQLVKKMRPRVCFEIGTFDGRTTLNLAANGGEDCCVYTLDLPRSEADRTTLELAAGDQQFVDKAVSGSRFQGTAYEKRIHQLYGDSATFDFAPYRGRVDFVFVDGSHSYAYVKNDTEVALSLLRDGKGIILWHDYTSPYWKGLTRALNELYRQDRRLRGMRHISGTTLVCLLLV